MKEKLRKRIKRWHMLYPQVLMQVKSSRQLMGYRGIHDMLINELYYKDQTISSYMKSYYVSFPTY